MARIAKYIIIPLILVIAGTLLSFIFYKEAYITVIQIHHENVLPQEFISRPLIKGRLYKGEVTARYNNLGAVQLRINTYGRINYNTIQFRLREKGETSWSVTNNYVVDVFPNRLLYAFGFPPINNSQGKTYEFQITSDNGTPDQAIGFNGGYHEAATLYVFPINGLMHNKGHLQFFLKAKLISLVTDPYYLLYFGMFLVPTALYLLLISPFNKKTVWYSEGALFAYMITVFMFLPVSMQMDAMLYIYITCIVLVSIHLLRAFSIRISAPIFLSSEYLYALAVILVLLMVSYICLGKDLEAERTAVAVFYVMLTSITMSYWELRRKR